MTDTEKRKAAAAGGIPSEELEILGENGEWRRWGASGLFFRRKPWSLPEPPKGKRWHREGWTAEMLPDGYRPLLEGEIIQRADRCFYDEQWQTPGEGAVGEPCEKYHFNFRTTRPLPPEPVTRPWQGPDDVPGPVVWLRKSDGYATLVTWVDQTGVFIQQTPRVEKQTILFGKEFSDWQYSTTRRADDWHPCAVTEPTP